MKTPQEVFKEVIKDLGFCNYKQSEMSNSDNWMCTVEAMERYSSQFEPKWISVNDSLPEDNKDVLMSYGNDTVIGLYRNETWWAKGLNGYFLHSRLKPTHYMPLPEPPKQ